MAVLAVGDIVWVEFDPVMGTEQAGRRPALVLSDQIYHEVSSRVIVCPISSTGKLWPFNVPLSPGMKTRGFVLVDQVRAVHRASRVFHFIETAPPRLLSDVRATLGALIGLSNEESDRP
jgi:mRNA interferase MazF